MSPPLRRALPWLPALLAAACVGGPGPDDPVVVLISIDTLRADHVGLYGYDRDTTPNLDRFFGEATVFEHAVSPAPCTVPAIRQVLSGGFDLAPERPRLPEILRDAGFRTMASTSQQMFRFDVDGAYERGFDAFEMQRRYERDPYWMSARTADTVVSRGLSMMKGWPWDTGPTFVWFHLFDPHDPYTPPRSWEQWAEGFDSTTSGDRRGTLMAADDEGGKWTWLTKGHIYDDDDVGRLVGLYDGELGFADDQLGRVFDHLEATGLADRALVVFWADHGEFLGEDDAWDHCRTLHEREIHVPFLVRDPSGRIAPGRVDTPVSTLDLLPTIVGTLGLDLPDAPYHGVDLGLGVPADRVIASQWKDDVALRRGPYKLQIDGGTSRLYDLSADPEQERPLPDDHPVARELATAAAGLPGLSATVAEENAETMEFLKAIGYTE